MIPYLLRIEMRDNDIRSVRDHVRRRFGRVIAWTPRLLGLTPSSPSRSASWARKPRSRTAAILPEATATRDQINALLALDAVTAAAFVYFVVKRQRIAKFIGASMAICSCCTDASPLRHHGGVRFGSDLGLSFCPTMRRAR